MTPFSTITGLLAEFVTHLIWLRKIVSCRERTLAQTRGLPSSWVSWYISIRQFFSSLVSDFRTSSFSTPQISIISRTGYFSPATRIWYIFQSKSSSRILKDLWWMQDIFYWMNANFIGLNPTDSVNSARAPRNIGIWRTRRVRDDYSVRQNVKLQN